MKYRLGKTFGINFVDSTTLNVCDSHRIHILGSPVSLEQLQEDDESFECTRSFFDEESATPQEVNQLEQDFLKIMNKDEKRLYFLCKDGKTQKEIAEILKIQQGSVSKRVAKLKDKFKAFIR